jgi:uncharacterized membrane protein YfcA
MAFGRIAIGWALVAGWLLLWAEGERRRAGGERLRPQDVGLLVGEALVLALFGGLWFGSLGAGGWWLVFALLGALMEWPVRTVAGAARTLRIVVAGALLAWRLGP